MIAQPSVPAFAIGIAAVALILLAGAGAQQAVAQGQPPPERPSPTLPDGITVSPVRPMPRPLSPEVRERSGEPAPGPGRAPQGQPHGGCRYEDQPLELLV